MTNILLTCAPPDSVDRTALVPVATLIPNRALITGDPAVYNIGTVGKASPVIADGKIYVPETNGNLHILELTDDGVKPLDHDQLTIAEGDYAEFYGSVAIAYGRVYFATEGSVY